MGSLLTLHDGDLPCSDMKMMFFHEIRAGWSKIWGGVWLIWNSAKAEALLDEKHDLNS